MKPMGLRHLALKTRKPKAAEAFYIEVLGLEVAFREKGMVFLRSPGGDNLLNLCRPKLAWSRIGEGSTTSGFISRNGNSPR